MEPITAGTISVDNDSTTVTGDGTTFTALRAGDTIRAIAAGVWVVVGTVAETPASNTVATIASPFPGTAIENAAWEGVRGPGHVQGAEMASNVLTLLQRLSGRGTTGAEEDFSAIDTLFEGGQMRDGDLLRDLATNRLWQRAGGNLEMVGSLPRFDDWITIASASTTNIGAIASDHVVITGNAIINTFADAPYRHKLCRVTGTPTIAAAAAENLSANRALQAGDAFLAVSDGAGAWRVWHLPHFSVAGPETTTANNLAQWGSGTRRLVAGRPVGVGSDSAIPDRAAADARYAFKQVSANFQPTLTFNAPGNLSVSYDVRLSRVWDLGELVVWWVFIDATPTYTTASGSLQIPLPLLGDANFRGIAILDHASSSPVYPSGISTIIVRNTGSQAQFLGRGNGAATTIEVAHVPSGERCLWRFVLIYKKG